MQLYKNPTDNKINKLYNITQKFIKDNPNIIFTMADKENITVALEKENYVITIEEMLNDTDMYTKITKDPTKKLTSFIRNVLSRWKIKGYITYSTYNSIYCSDGNLPRAYRLPKIHKLDRTFKIIISSIDSSTLISYFLLKIIAKNIDKSFSYVENSYQLVQKLKGLSLVSDKFFFLVSLDVISLYTNVPLNLVLESISNRWFHICRGTKIPKSEFLNAIKIILDSTFFKFNNNL